MTRDLTPATWRKSSFSNSQAACVEVADVGDGRAVRDSKNPTGGHLMFTATAWTEFVTGVKSGEFD